MLQTEEDIEWFFEMLTVFPQQPGEDLEWWKTTWHRFEVTNDDPF